MEVEYKKKAKDDRAYWKQTGNLKVQKRISDLVNDLCEHPFTGKRKKSEDLPEMAGLFNDDCSKINRNEYLYE